MKDPKLARLERKLRRRQKEYGVMLKDMAELAGVSRQHYSYYVRGKANTWTDVAEKIANSKIFDDEEIAKYSPQPEPEPEERVIEYPEAMSNPHQRIPNIPDFYERLDSITDINGKIFVDDDHPTLESLKKDVGAVKEFVYTREELADTLKDLRKKKELTQVEASELIGISISSYLSYEYGANKARGVVYEKIIRSPLFEKEE